jgi:hypothetical protein
MSGKRAIRDRRACSITLQLYAVGLQIQTTTTALLGVWYPWNDDGCFLKFPRPRADCDRRAVVLVGDTGIEPVTATVSNQIMSVALRIGGI